MTRRLLAAGLVLIMGFATGCSRDFSVEFERITTPEADGARDVSVTFEQVRLEEGFAVAVIARPQDNSDKMEWTTQIELEPSFNGVFGIQRLAWDEEAEESRDYDLRDGDWSFVLWGMATGQGNLEVYIDGEFETDIPVIVGAQSTN